MFYGDISRYVTCWYLMYQPKAYWLLNNGFFLSQWLAHLNNKHIVYKRSNIAVFFTASKHIFAVRLDYACTLSVISKWRLPLLWSYLPRWLWLRPKKKVWITYTIVSTGFSLLKNILTTVQRKKVGILYKYHIGFGFRMWKIMQISNEILHLLRSITLSLISIILRIILSLIQ